MGGFDQWLVARRLRVWRGVYLRRRLSEYLGPRLATLTGPLWRWHARRKTYYELLALSDQQLQDIGLYREQLDTVAAALARAPRSGSTPPSGVVALPRRDPASTDAGRVGRAA